MSFVSSFVGFGPLPASIVGLVASGPLVGVFGHLRVFGGDQLWSALFSLPIVIVSDSPELPQPAIRTPRREQRGDAQERCARTAALRGMGGGGFACLVHGRAAYRNAVCAVLLGAAGRPWPGACR